METVNLIYYSPTGTTQKILRKLGGEFGQNLIKEYNITASLTDSKPDLSSRCLTVIGMPTYSGRLPIAAVEKLEKLQANNAPAVIIVVYGNRAYDDSLLGSD